MQNLMNWGVSLPRMFGIPVKVHWLFFLVTGGLFFRQVLAKDNVVWWGDVFLLSVVALFGIVLLHELGHCLAGRLVGGEPQEILIWPLGGLAMVDVPHTPRASFITTAGGPMVNLVLAIIFGMVLALSGFTPNPLTLDPYTAAVKHRDGKVYTSEYGLKLYKPGSNEPAELPPTFVVAYLLKKDLVEANKLVPDNLQQYERAQLTTGMTWVYRLFWINCVLLAFNMLPAYPLDGGQLLLAVLWARRGYRPAVQTAGYIGFGTGVLMMVVSIAFNETLFMALAISIMFAAYTRVVQAEGDTEYGDFSQGYTSYEKDEEPPPPRPKVGPVKKWLQARAARRIQKELEAQQADELRMDQLLDKIQRLGKASLTDEERRFMERVSARYRNR